MASSAGSSRDNGQSSSRQLPDLTIKTFGASFLMQVHVTAALMANVEATRVLPLPEDARQRMEALLNEAQKDCCRTGTGLMSLAYDMESNECVLKIKRGEDGGYVLNTKWEEIARDCQLRPGAVVSLWGYQYRESAKLVLPVFLFRFDGTAEENEPLPSYEPPDFSSDEIMDTDFDFNYDD